MADAGYIVLFLALLLALFTTLAYAISGSQGRHSGIARYSLLITFGLVSAAVAILMVAVFTHDFSLAYVAKYSSRDMTAPYLFSVWWAGSGGSLLFWAWSLCLFAALMVIPRRGREHELTPYASAIVMFTEAFFLFLLVTAGNPFRELAVVPPDGTQLNPLLSNPGMIFHPPALLAGYAALTIPFAFALSALISGNYSKEWTIAARRWALVGWLLLGLGNIIGAWWAYVELSFKGYWAWDAVENASLMPWLALTAYLHSTMVQRRRGMFKFWSLLLVIISFFLTVFGTYLNRSDVLQSVHTFGETGVAPFFMVFLIISLVGSLGLVFWRRQELTSEAEVDSLVSRESTFLANNLFMLGSTFIILFGTIAPWITRVFTGTSIGVGKAFFNMVNGPIFLAVILLAGLCAVIGWQRKSNASLARNLMWPVIGAVLVAAALVVFGMRNFLALAAFFVCSLSFFMILWQWSQEVRAHHQARSENYLKSFACLLAGNRPHYGGHIVHISVIIMALGVIGSAFFGGQTAASLKAGQSMTVEGYTITFDNVSHSGTATRTFITANLSVRAGDRAIGFVRPEMILDQEFGLVPKVGILSTLMEDLYVTWDQTAQDGTLSLDAMVKPLAAWLWLGGAIMVLGGLVAVWPARRANLAAKRAADVEEAAPVEAGPAPKGAGFCPKCGAKSQAGDRYCARCGGRLR